jgi:hypothetical protein
MRHLPLLPFPHPHRRAADLLAEEASSLATLQTSHRHLRLAPSNLSVARISEADAREERDRLLARVAHASMRAATSRPAWVHPGAHRPALPPTPFEAAHVARTIAQRGRTVLSLEASVAEAKESSRLASQAHRRATLLHREAREKVKIVEAAQGLHDPGSAASSAMFLGSW